MSQQFAYDNNHAAYDDAQYAYNLSLSDNIHQTWDSLKEKLYLYSITTKAERGHYQNELISQLVSFHNLLEDVPEFIYDFYMVKSRANDDNPWHTHTVMKDNYMKADMMTVYGELPTPLFDHNGLAVLSFVLSGQANVNRYQHLPNTISPHYPIAKLVGTDNFTLTQGQVLIITPELGNITEIQSLTENTVLLNIHLINATNDIGSWYFPISPKPKQRHEAFFTQRIRRTQ